MDIQAENRMSKRAESWDAMYALARQYYVDHGDLDVPSNYVTPTGERLGAWLNRQRRIRDGKVKGGLTEERIRALDAIGMSWLDLGEERWNRNFRALKAYYDQNGDLDVPQTYVTSDGIRLGQFVKNLRFQRDTKYRKCLTPSRVIQLTQMGMIWDVDEYRWQENYKAAKAYYQEYGNLTPIKRYVSPTGVKLGVWLSYQRQKYAKGSLSEEKIEKLEAVGMLWDLNGIR